ncbi:glycoside hydrolase family 28 protein [Exilibacterium tricleocarpae]|nr:glycoside hydrolase family 28 protein [Exilibacterium tricleocarpae]
MSDLRRRELLKHSCVLFGLAATGCTGHLASSIPAATAAPWRRAQQIVEGIQAPVITGRDYDIRAFGARPGAGSDSLPAIKNAIAACNAAGGGRVVVPAGLWRLDGPIHLQSDMALHLERGAHIRFSGDREFYKPLVRTRWEGTEVYNYSPMIFGNGLRNVAITGPGIIDGQGAANFLPWRKKQKADKNRLRQMGHDGVPVEQRVFGDGHWLRPQFVQFYNCRQVLIDGPTLIDSPFWVMHLVYCDQAIVRNVTVNSTHINSDGVDPDSSTNVLIENCNFNVGDDGVAIKSGRDQDGWRVGRPSRNIVVRNCEYTGNTGGGMAIGSEMSGGVSDVYVENYKIPRSNHALYFKSNLDRGGNISNIHIRDIQAERAASVIIFTNDYHGYRGGNHPPRFENVSIRNVNCREARVGLHIIGHPRAPVRNIALEDVIIGRAEIPMQIRDIENLSFDNVQINGLTQEVVDIKFTEKPVKLRY